MEEIMERDNCVLVVELLQHLAIEKVFTGQKKSFHVRMGRMLCKLVLHNPICR